MQREHKVYLEDILTSIEKIERYLKGISYKKFSKDSMICDAVIRNLEVIGEATKNVSLDIKKEYKDIEWKKISGLRDILIHAYFGIDLKIVWDIVTNKLPELKKLIKVMMRNIK